MTKGQPEPAVGMGVTMLYWTDRYAATIVEVSRGGKKVAVQKDKSTYLPKNGRSRYETEMQDYTYEANPHAPVEYFTLRKNGRWVRLGSDMKGTSLMLDVRDEYRDPHF